MKKALCTVLAMAVLLGIFAFVPPLATAGADAGEAIQFNDPALEAIVRKQLNKPEGGITPGDAAALEWLDANADPNAPESARVRDISALRHFVNLVGIKLDNNLVSDISVLTKLPNLRELWLLENPLSSLEPLGSLTKLVKLGFNCGMRDISFLGSLTNLEELRVDGCRELPKEIVGLKKLKVFCSLGGELADISLLAQIPTLEVVDVSWNLVTDLTPLANLPLVELYLQGNPIGDFTPIKALYPNLLGRNFEYIEYAQPENPGAVITFPDPVMEMKVRKAMNIPEGDITAGDAAKITTLDIRNEWSQQIPREIMVKNLQGIECFINLRELSAMFNDISDISALSGLKQLRGLDMGGNPIGDISALSSLINLERLTLFGGLFKDVNPLAGLTSLNFLNLGGIQLYDISPLAGLTKIDNLYLGGCGIDDISALTGMTKMLRIELQDNYISDLSALGGMASLAALKLANNPVQDYSPIEELYPRLQEKDFEYGQIFNVQLPLKPKQPEEQAVISDAGLEAILRETTGIFNRPMTYGDLSRIGKIAGSTDGMWQSVSDITALKHCLNLDGLVIFGSNVSDLTPLAGLKRLRILSILDSAVNDVTPLGDLRQLILLELKGNRITDVSSIKNLTQLERLDVANNQIADFSPLYGLDRLSVLFIGNNPAGNTSGFAGIFERLNEKDFEPGKPTKPEEPEEPVTLLAQPKDPGKVIKFSDKAMERRVREAIGKPEGNITAGDAAMVEELNLGNEWQEKFPKGSQISNLSGIEHFINLKNLDISWNKIKDVKKLSGLARLEYLKAFGNQIGSLAPLEKLVNLRSLNVGGNKLAKIDVLKNLVNLTSLYLDGNKIKDYSPLEALYPQLTDKDFTLE
jgi:internalin A